MLRMEEGAETRGPSYLPGGSYYWAGPWHMSGSKVAEIE
jgi:hypothetical protein